jgi:hypothetical protein
MTQDDAVVVAQVPFAHVHQTWPHVEKFFEAVAPHSGGDFTLEQMRGKVFTNEWALITVTCNHEIIGMVTVTYINKLNHRVAFIPALGGRGITTEDNWVALKAIFARNGATYVEAAMRPATLRLWQQLGFVEKYRIAGVSL